MKKVLALVLAVVMALSVATVVAADGGVTINPDPVKPITPGSTAVEYDGFYGDDAWDAIWLLPGADFDKAANTADGIATFLTKDKSFTVSGGVDNDKVTVSYKLVKNAAKDGVAIKITAKPAAAKFTVNEKGADETKVKFVVVQADKNKKTSASVEFKFNTINRILDETGIWSDANDKFIAQMGKNRVVDVTVFDAAAANGNALAVEFDNYSVNFPKVDKQNTSLYLFADTGVVEGKAIASIKFAPTLVKDAMEVTMPISNDNENYYGEKVYVYKVVDGKPAGEAIEGTIVNHNAVMFKVEAGTRLGAFAAYGDKAEGDAEVPAIPETGADVINVAIVFAVLALVATGFVAVAKASK